MNILITNDDGITSIGLEALVRELSTTYQIFVAAPHSQQSGRAHALSIEERLYVHENAELQKKYNVRAVSVTGTPTDCVKLFLERIAVDEGIKIDAVLSGINDGPNTGSDVLYSGTLGAALEGYFHKLPSLAISRDFKSNISFDQIARDIANNLAKLLSYKALLNINYPVEVKENYQYIWAKQGWRDYENAFVPNTDDKGKTYYKIGGDIVWADNHEFDDIEINLKHNVSITPITIDWTDYQQPFLELGRSAL